ncbi:dihydroneopterin aldolase [Limibaculum sp. FT325]|uniref:dihydroneopterin aldolase n=1 Tax=Thermohalobaculum sediminis TaxID=2939436 RepID=UPI0020C02738|nr:dihydroneopterin aldolase [Limibaculum sediminis]MCL5776743.1 dihydroneopterin aldolase [Limibaculum sediminis]
MVERALLPQRLDVETEMAMGQDMVADRIFLLDYLREIEIGAYAEEVGVTQRVRFDIVLEVTRNTAHIDDRVGRVINYDDLVDAIETIAQGPRITLLETFAERLAQAVLVDPRARRVHVRIEKLDRLPNGARLGVEISRVRTPETNEKIWALASEVK